MQSAHLQKEAPGSATTTHRLMKNFRINDSFSEAAMGVAAVSNKMGYLPSFCN